MNDKIFAMLKGNHDEGGHRWGQRSDGLQQALLELAPDRFFVPAYVGHKGWIGIYLDLLRVDWAEVADFIENSYRLMHRKILSNKLVSAKLSESPNDARRATFDGASCIHLGVTISEDNWSHTLVASRLAIACVNRLQ